MTKMLKIVVCVSSSFFSESPVSVKLTDGKIETGTKGPVIEAVNYSDRCALEEAQRFKQECGDVEVTVVMAGPPDYQWVLESCFCFEIDKAVYLQVSDWEPMDSYGCSLIISDFIREVGADLVLCGDVNTDFESGQVAPILAELLSIPYVSRAIGLSIIAGQSNMEVERKLTRGNRQRLRVTLPAVASVDIAANQPRYISVHSRIKENKGKPVIVTPIDRQELESKFKGPINLVNILNIGPVRLRPKKVAIPDSKMSAQDRLSFLMGGGNKKKSSNGDKEILEGKTETQVDKTLAFLKKSLPDLNKE